jgi:hypothetical protein
MNTLSEHLKKDHMRFPFSARLRSRITPVDPSRSREIHNVRKSPPQFSQFLILPGEIRNQIYDILVVSSLDRKSGPNSFRRQRNERVKFSITALPRWTGSPLVRFADIDPLPILFTSRQVYHEVSTLLYSRVDTLTLGGYVLQNRDENPTVRWQSMFEALERRPGLVNAVRGVTVRLPSAREDLLKGYWLSLGLLTPRDKVEPVHLMSGIPSLVAFLQKFQALEKMKIVVTVEERDPPIFEQLLALWDICGSNTEMDFVVSIWDRSTSTAWMQKWTDTWVWFLRAKGRRSVLEQATDSVTLLRGGG